MKLFIITIVIALFSLNIKAQENQWVTVKDTEMEYRVDFPNEAKKGKQDVPTQKGTIAMHTYTYASSSIDEKNLLYMSSFTEYPGEFFSDGLETDEAQNLALDNSVKGAVNNVNGTLLQNDKIIFNGYPGRHIKIEIDKGALYVMTMRNILVGLRMYVLQTIALKDKSDNLESKKFFDSFELIKVKN